MRKYGLLLAGCWCGLMIGCGEESTAPQPEQATLRLWLTDKPAAFDAVNITFTEVSAHRDNQWVVLSDRTQTVNLLEWNNGKTLLLGQAEVEAGAYTQIRLQIAAAEVVWQGQSFSLDVPSGAQSGLKLLANFEVAAGSTYDLVLDFDAQRSIVITGPRQQPNGFKLKPVIRVAALALTGSISGTIVNPEALPVAYAIAAGDTVTASVIEPASGFFRLAFLPPGVYNVHIADALGRSFLQEQVPVTAGKDFGLGTVTLQ